MAFSFDHNHIRRLCVDRKRCFLILLFVNSFLGCIYYLHEQKLLENRTFTRPIQTNINDQQIPIKINQPIQFIRNILDKEYNPNDLVTFYEIVEKEFSLGLRCTRKPIQAQPQTITTKSNDTINNRTESNITIIARSSSATVIPSTNHSLISQSRHHQRRNLYTFTINNSDGCSNDRVDLLVIIISKSENYKTRDAIRRTWGSGKNLGSYSSIHIKFFFLIDLDEKLSDSIRLENNLFHDIIQVELPQQYTLVTHRVLSLVEWSFRYCHSARYLFKTDDDIFINLILLLKFISPSVNQTLDNSFKISDMNLYGYKHYKPRVFRHADDVVGARYVVTSDEFPCGTYPDFLSGFGYLIPRKARDALVYATHHDRDVPFRISDVYITGILPDYLSLPRYHMSDYTIRYEGNCENFFDHPKAFACAIGLHHGDKSDIFAKFNQYWQRVRKFL